MTKVEDEEYHYLNRMQNTNNHPDFFFRELVAKSKPPIYVPEPSIRFDAVTGSYRAYTTKAEWNSNFAVEVVSAVTSSRPERVPIDKAEEYAIETLDGISNRTLHSTQRAKQKRIRQGVKKHEVEDNEISRRVVEQKRMEEQEHELY